MADPLETLTHPPEARPKLRNWSSTYNVSPELLFHPCTNAEVALILKEAERRGKKVRAVGLHNSPGPIWHSDQWLISLRHFTHSSFPSTSRTAILGAGLSLRDANPLLASHGYSLPTLGSLPDVTVGACFSAPDHGSSAYHPISAGAAKAVTIVLPTGKVRRVERGDELFRAAGAGVAAVGLVTEVEFECEEAFGLEFTMSRTRLEDYLDEDDSGRRLWELARSSEYVKLWYYPGANPTSTSPNAILWRASRCPLPPPQKNTLYTRLSAQLPHLIHATAFFITTYLFPALQPWLNALGYWLLAATCPKSQRLRSYEAQYMDCGYWQLVDEWSAPLPAPSASASAKAPPAPAAQILRQLVDFLASPGGRRVGMHAPMELRFSRVKGEEFFLSPAASYGELLGREDNEDDLVMWFEPIIYRPLNLPTPSRFYHFLTFFESLFRSRPASRPHWTKPTLPFTESERERMFGKKTLEKWRKVRETCDTSSVLWSEWLEERVGSGKEKEGREAEAEGGKEDVVGQPRWWDCWRAQ
ncbi:D-arabinono-1,4-lactone oxidase [Rhodotorula toruloides]